MNHERNGYKRVNLDLTRKDWCSYKGECLQRLNVTNGLCYHCRYKIPLDIPKMIKEYLKNGEKK